MNKLRPIHLHVYGYIEIVKLLIDKNVDLEAKNVNKWRPIHLACHNGSVEIVKLLIDKNVDLEAENFNKCRPIQICIEKMVHRYSFFISRIWSKNKLHVKIQ